MSEKEKQINKALLLIHLKSCSMRDKIREALKEIGFPSRRFNTVIHFNDLEEYLWGSYPFCNFQRDEETETEIRRKLKTKLSSMENEWLVIIESSTLNDVNDVRIRWTGKERLL